MRRIPEMHPRTTYGDMLQFARSFLQPEYLPPRCDYIKLASAIHRRANGSGLVGDIARGLVANRYNKYPKE